MLSRLVNAHLSLGDGPDELVVESIAVPPARTVAGLIRDVPTVKELVDRIMSEAERIIGKRLNGFMQASA